MFWVGSIELEQGLSIETEVSRLKRGDPEAFEALLLRYRNRLYRYILRLVGEAAQAEDLFQQTWLRVMTRLNRYDTRRPFEPWLFAVARNLAIDHLRRTAPWSLDPEGLEALASDNPSALATLLERERQSLLEAKLAALPLLYREALSLRFEEEMTFAEMASVLDCPLSTAKSRVQRGLQLLRHRMRRPSGETS